MAVTQYELVDSIKLNDCLYATADAIREKTKTDDAIIFDFANSKGFADAIASIPSGSTEVTIRFYDYDGELIRGYTQEEIREMTELPAPPTHENLTFLGWTKTLDALKSYPYSVGVYAKFKPTDGKTRIWLSFAGANKAPTIRFVQTKSQGLLFDWGDGTTERVAGTGNLSKTHTYAGGGAYTITITPDADCMWTPNWSGSSNNTLFPSYNSSVIKAEFGDNISAIGAYAFYNCNNMRSILFPEGIAELPDNVCSGCNSLRALNIPSTVNTIKTNAFYNCVGLQQLDIPDTVTAVYSTAFTDCHGLSKVFIPASLMSTGASNNSWLRGAKLKTATPIGQGGDIEYGWTDAIPANAFCYNSLLEELVLPAEITIIPNYMCSNATALKEINIPRGVTNIGTYAFNYCTAVQRVEIPDSVTTINASAFSNCNALQKMIIPSSVTVFPQGTNYWASGCYSLRKATPIGQGGDIEYGWTDAIPSYAFNGMSIDAVEFPEQLKTISGFTNLRYITELTIPDSVTSIGAYAFYGSSSIDTLTLPETIDQVGGSSFAGCSLLTELLLPRVTQISGSSIFQNMIALEHIQIGSVGYGVTSSRNDIFSYTYNPSLVIEVYTVSNYVNSILNNIRNGATTATIIIRASSDTVYNGVTYQAGDIILTSAS